MSSNKEQESGRDTFYVYDEHKYPIFEVTIVSRKPEYKEVFCDFVVKRIVSWELSDIKEPYETEDYMEAQIKWDSCSHLRFGEIGRDGNRDAYFHFCGAQAFKNHVRLLNVLYNRAFQEMDREPYDKSEVWEAL